MYVYKLPNAAACMITVTGTATSPLDLIATAAGEAHGVPGGANAIDITPEDGDIRLLMDGNTPTATQGILLKQGVMYSLRNVPLSKMKLIRKSGSVSCSVEVGMSTPEEMHAFGGSAANVSITADTEFPAAAALTDNYANPTTTVAGAMTMIWDGATWDRAPGNATDGLKVNLGADNDVTLAVLPDTAGGALAAIAASASVLDDWDETDRAKVNPVVGQAGLAAGTGLDAANALRVSLATDIPLPAGTNAIGKLSANSGVDIGDVDVATIGGQAPTYGAGAVAAGTPRTTLASDDPAVVALQIMDDWDNAASDGASVSGDTAHDAVDAGEPVKVGYKAYAFDGTTPQAAVAEADRANAISDLQGIQYVQTAHPAFWHVSLDYASAQTNATVKAAPGAGSLYITDIFVSNGATAGNITLLDGSGGTVLFECYPGINGGAVLNLKNPIKLSATTLLAITSTTVTTHSLTICGFTA